MSGLIIVESFFNIQIESQSMDSYRRKTPKDIKNLFSMKNTVSIKNEQKLVLKTFSIKHVFQRNIKSSIKPKMRRNKFKETTKYKTTIYHH